MPKRSKNLQRSSALSEGIHAETQPLLQYEKVVRVEVLGSSYDRMRTAKLGP
jgi:hypothetical protein